MKARAIIIGAQHSQPCIDELEVYGAGDGKNLAVAGEGAKATASSCLSGYAIHQISHLNDGLYGNSHSWIAVSSERRPVRQQPQLDCRGDPERVGTD